MPPSAWKDWAQSLISQPTIPLSSESRSIRSLKYVLICSFEPFKLFIVYVFLDDLLPLLLDIYRKDAKCLPSAEEVLVCYAATSAEEVRLQNILLISRLLQ